MKRVSPTTPEPLRGRATGDQSLKESVPVEAIKPAKAEGKPIVEPACSEENDDVTQG